MVRWDWKEGKFLGNASVATLGPNLILLNYKVGINVVSYLLDFETMHLFVKPNVVKQLGWVVKKVVKPIQVQLAKGDVKSVHVVALGANLKSADSSLKKTSQCATWIILMPSSTSHL
jgi:hypothetical protein